MTLQEFLIAIISIFFIFDSITIHLINISFIFLLLIYIISVIEISFGIILYKKLRGLINEGKENIR